MTYRIHGLEPAQFSSLFSMNEVDLTAALARRVIADGEGRYPCRVSLRDADPGDEMVLTHFTNHEVNTPYRNAFAIFVRKEARAAAQYVDALPPVLRGRPIALRGYSAEGSLHRAELSVQDDVDERIKLLLEDPAVAYIDSHNAMHGCFAARIERYDGASND